MADSEITLWAKQITVAPSVTEYHLFLKYDTTANPNASSSTVQYISGEPQYSAGSNTAGVQALLGYGKGAGKLLVYSGDYMPGTPDYPTDTSQPILVGTVFASTDATAVQQKWNNMLGAANQVADAGYAYGPTTRNSNSLIGTILNQTDIGTMIINHENGQTAILRGDSIEVYTGIFGAPGNTGSRIDHTIPVLGAGSVLLGKKASLNDTETSVANLTDRNETVISDALGSYGDGGGDDIPLPKPLMDADNNVVGTVSFTREGETNVATAEYVDGNGQVTATERVDSDGNRTITLYDVGNTQPWTVRSVTLNAEGVTIARTFSYDTGDSFATHFDISDDGKTTIQYSTIVRADESAQHTVATTTTSGVSSVQTDYDSAGIAQSQTSTIVDSFGTRTIVSEQPLAGGQFAQTTTMWPGGGTVVQTDSPGGGYLREVTATIDGQVVVANFTVDSSTGKETLSGIVSINGQPPTDASAVASELQAANLTSTQMAQIGDGSTAPQGSGGSNLQALRTDVSSTVAAYDATNATGIVPVDTPPTGDGGPVTNPGFNQLGNVAGAITGVANLIRAIQSGNPLSIATAGVTALNNFDGFDSSIANSPFGLSVGGISSVLQGINSANSFIDAINRGNVEQALQAGLGVASSGVGIARIAVSAQYNALKAIAQPGDLADQLALADLQGTLDDLTGAGAAIGAVTNGINAVEAFNSGHVVDGVIDGAESIGDIVALAFVIAGQPEIAAVILAVETVVSALQSFFEGLFSGGSPFNPPGGMAHLGIDGQGNLVSVMDSNYSGGGDHAQQALQGVINALGSITATLRADGNANAYLIPERLSPLRDGYGVQLEQTGLFNWSMWDTAPNGTRRLLQFGSDAPNSGVNGRLTPVPLDSPSYFSSDFSNTIIGDALANALGPQWEAQTAFLQVQNGQAWEGQTEFVHAQQLGQLALTNTGASETAALVTLDLAGLGSIPIATRASGHGVMFDINSSGYVNGMDWVGPRVGILGIEFDGKLDNGQDLLDDPRVQAGVQGVQSLGQFATTNSGLLTAADPVFSHLVVWTDTNQDGIAQANEVQTMAQLGITALDYAHGTFVQNGVTKLLATTSLTADTQGVITQAINGGVVIAKQDGTINELVTQVGDLTQLGQQASSTDGTLTAGYDSINAVENTLLTVSAAQLLVNDSDIDPGAGTLTIASVGNALSGNAFNGSASLSSDGKTIAFTPNQNFAGAGEFTYTVKDATGRTAQGFVQINVAHVEQAPQLTATHALETMGVDANNGKYFTPWNDSYSIDSNGTVSWTYAYSGPVANVANPYAGQILVTDPDVASGFTYQIVNGSATIDQNGHWSMVADSLDGSQGAFEVKVTASDGLSTTQRVIVDATNFELNYTGGGDGTSSGDSSGVGDGGSGGDGGGGGDGGPIVLDLNRSGINFSSQTVTLDFQAGQGPKQYAWVQAPAAFLAFDPSGSGTISNASEISFVQYKAGAKTDLQGLAAFDTNHDGVISAADNVVGGFQFNNLLVWTDTNGDGIAQAGEVETVVQAGIKSISLASTDSGVGAGVAGATFYGTTQVGMTDGSTIMAADIALSTTAATRFNPIADLMGFSSAPALTAGSTATINSDGSVVINLAPDPTTGNKGVITISSDGSTQQFSLYVPGFDASDPILSRVATVVTNHDGSWLARVVDVDGSQPWQAVTRTYNAAGVLQSALTVNDDQSTIVYTANPSGMAGVVGLTEYYNAQGIRTAEMRVVANGSSTTEFYNAAGQRIEEAGVRTNGSGWDYKYTGGAMVSDTEIANGNATAFGWTSYTDYYNSTGQRVEEKGTHASGISWDYVYVAGALSTDTETAHGNATSLGWISYTDFYTSGTQRVEETGTHTNGATWDYKYTNGVLTTDIETANANASAWGWTSQTTIYAANGTATRTTLDGANAEPWSEHDETLNALSQTTSETWVERSGPNRVGTPAYNSLGQEMSEVIDNGDGTQDRLAYDVNNSQSWAYTDQLWQKATTVSATSSTTSNDWVTNTSQVTTPTWVPASTYEWVSSGYWTTDESGTYWVDTSAYAWVDTSHWQNVTTTQTSVAVQQVSHNHTVVTQTDSSELSVKTVNHDGTSSTTTVANSPGDQPWSKIIQTYEGGQLLDTVTKNDNGNQSIAINRTTGGDNLTVGNSDTITFASGINYNQIWFSQSGNNLVMSVDGQNETMTISNWYSSSANQPGQIVSGDGYSISDAGVQQMVQAMVSFTPPPSGQTSLSAATANSLAASLAANWRHA
jgi:hypothetical protein